MAPTSSKMASSIALALAGMTESVKIPKPRDGDFWAGKETFAAVAAKSLPVKQSAGLPTPPNSVSPSLPPQAYKAQGSNGPPTPPAAPQQVDSDIDLEDAVEHAKAQDSPQRGLTAHRLGNLVDSDAFGDITPGLLAKHHLPGILLENGPLAIRHVMGYLTTSVPGFSGIPPAKARRLVVGALEGRGNDGQGGLHGDVIFEKVGWGRWDARRRGQPSRDHHTQPPPPEGSLRIPVQSTRKNRTRDMPYGSHESNGSYDTPMEDVSMLEHEADKMSLDNDETMSSSPSRDKPALDFDLDDVTDEEDWASIGAAALRKGSFPLTGGPIASHLRHSPKLDPKSRGRRVQRKPSSNLAKSMTLTNTVHYKRHQRAKEQQTAPEFSPLPESMIGSQDREAVEALLRLSSV